MKTKFKFVPGTKTETHISLKRSPSSLVELYADFPGDLTLHFRVEAISLAKVNDGIASFVQVPIQRIYPFKGTAIIGPAYGGLCIEVRPVAQESPQETPQLLFYFPTELPNSITVPRKMMLDAIKEVCGTD